MTLHLPEIDTNQLVADRRHLHANPELAYEEFETALFIEKRVRELGYDVQTGVGKTGVVATRKGTGGKCVLLRADMDALPVQEENDVPFRSTVQGRMHACGHDGHVAVGLATAARLAQVDLPGSVRFAFQPAEEGGNGAEAMINDGTLKDPRVDAAFGMHLWTYLPVGTIAVTGGPVFASADGFEITVRGRGGHAAIPDQTIDPVVISAQIISALQTVVSRRADPMEQAVVTVTAVHAGEAFNIIPETAVMRGTVRTFGGEIHGRVPDLMQDIVTGIARAMGGDASFEYTRMVPATVNDSAMATLMAEVAEEVVGRERVRHDERTMGAEDMSFFLQAAPGCYALVGCGNPDKGATYPHHSPHFTIDEDALGIAVELLSRTAVRYLSRP